MKGKLVRQFIPIFMIITILGMPIGGLTDSIQTNPEQNLIVLLDSYDSITNEAVLGLKENLDQYKIVRYGSPEYIWTVGLKSIENAILVGHGLEDVGVLINGKIVSWQGYAKIAEKINAQKLHFFNCGSSKISEYLKSKNIGVTFKSNIDAKLGSYIISLLIKPSDGSIFTKIKDRFVSIHSGKEEAKYLQLPVYQGWSGEEIAGQGLTLFFQALVTFLLFNPIGTASESGPFAVYLGNAMRKLGLIITIGSMAITIANNAAVYCGADGIFSMSFDQIGSCISTIFLDSVSLVLDLAFIIFDFIDYLYNQYGLYGMLVTCFGIGVALQIIGSFVVNLIADYASGLSLTALKIINAIFGWSVWIYFAVKDAYDTDSIFRATTGYEYPSSPSNPPPSNPPPCPSSPCPI